MLDTDQKQFATASNEFIEDVHMNTFEEMNNFEGQTRNDEHARAPSKVKITATANSTFN